MEKSPGRSVVVVKKASTQQQDDQGITETPFIAFNKEDRNLPFGDFEFVASLLNIDTMAPRQGHPHIPLAMKILDASTPICVGVPWSRVGSDAIGHHALMVRSITTVSNEAEDTTIPKIHCILNLINPHNIELNPGAFDTQAYNLVKKKLSKLKNLPKDILIANIHDRLMVYSFSPQGGESRFIASIPKKSVTAKPTNLLFTADQYGVGILDFAVFPITKEQSDMYKTFQLEPPTLISQYGSDTKKQTPVQHPSKQEVQPPLPTLPQVQPQVQPIPRQVQPPVQPTPPQVPQPVSPQAQQPKQKEQPLQPVEKEKQKESLPQQHPVQPAPQPVQWTPVAPQQWRTQPASQQVEQQAVSQYGSFWKPEVDPANVITAILLNILKLRGRLDWTKRCMADAGAKQQDTSFESLSEKLWKLNLTAVTPEKLGELQKELLSVAGEPCFCTMTREATFLRALAVWFYAFIQSGDKKTPQGFALTLSPSSNLLEEFPRVRDDGYLENYKNGIILGRNKGNGSSSSTTSPTKLQALKEKCFNDIEHVYKYYVEALKAAAEKMPGSSKECAEARDCYARCSRIITDCKNVAFIRISQTDSEKDLSEDAFRSKIMSKVCDVWRKVPAYYQMVVAESVKKTEATNAPQMNQTR